MKLYNLKTNKIFNNKIFYFLLIIFLTAYLIFNTGLFADDYSQSREWYGKSILNFFDFSHKNLGTKTLSRLPEYIIFYPVFFLVDINNFFLFDIFKILIVLISIFFIYFFGKVIFEDNKKKAIIFALIFIFYPSHESMLYYYTLLPYGIFLPAFFFFTIALILKNRYFYLSRIFFLICSFFSYSSPPYILSATFYFFLKKRNKDALFSLFCLLAYIVYYFYLFSLDKLDSRIPSKEINLIIFFKDILLQFVSSIDANLGFSFFYKIIISFKEATFVSTILIIILFFIITKTRFIKSSLDKSIITFFSIIFLSSLGMYAITGQYPQSPFNFANRVTIYFSPLVAYILTSYLQNFKSKLIIFFIIILPSFFLSDHAKQWNNFKKEIQTKILVKISNNPDIHSKQIFINHYMYSKLGKINHLEYLISPWILKSIFKHEDIHSIHSRTNIKNNFFIDEKFNKKIYLNKPIVYYDLKNNTLNKINKSEITKIINSTPIEIRHTIQLVIPEIIQMKFFYFFPKYKYLFLK